jgi:glycosyltransferase involved in cell wall biosynthesis
MAGTPLCSVVIPTYNRETLLRYTLNSLTRQSLPAEQFEVLVVDDGSTDSTAEVVESFRDRLQLRYFYQTHAGWRAARARNVGVANARAVRCVFVDSGVMLHSGCLAAHVESLDPVGGPVAVCGYVYCYNIDNEDADEMCRVIDVKDPDATIADLHRSGRWLDIREQFYETYGDDFNHLPAPWVVYWTCNVSARTADLRAVGAFDEEFRTWGGEDMDLGYRLHRHGARFVLDRRASAIHYPHEKNFASLNAGAIPNYEYMARKYRNPIVELLQHSPEINPFNINDIIVSRGLTQ